MTFPGKAAVRQGEPAALTVVERGSKIWPPCTAAPVHGLVPMVAPVRIEEKSPVLSATVGIELVTTELRGQSQLFPCEEEERLVLPVV